MASSWRDQRLWVEVFALGNIGGLTADIYLAHSMNFFRERAEYVPLVLSLAAPLALIVGLWAYARRRPVLWSALGFVVGWACVLVGLAGVMLHLESAFFQVRTLASLVYSAPFAAPLAYTGLGLLLLMNRMVAPESAEWPMWVLLLALGGYIGNFVFSVTDHAQNGFFYGSEWIGVVGGALGIGFLLMLFVRRGTREDVAACGVMMGLGATIGLLGLYFHLRADLAATDAPLMSRFVYGAPVFAPLLFVDMGVLAAIGLVVRWRHLGASAVTAG